MRSMQGSNCHVATSPRRDVSSKICTSSFKVRMAQKLGYWETYEERHGIPEQIDRDLKKCPGFGPFLIVRYYFLDDMMMFLILDNLIFSFMMF